MSQSGLPIIRTSVDHGTAYDIAGKGVADPGSLLEAIKLASRLARSRAGVPVTVKRDLGERTSFSGVRRVGGWRWKA